MDAVLSPRESPPAAPLRPSRRPGSAREPLQRPGARASTAPQHTLTTHHTPHTQHTQNTTHTPTHTPYTKHTQHTAHTKHHTHSTHQIHSPSHTYTPHTHTPGQGMKNQSRCVGFSNTSGVRQRLLPKIPHEKVAFGHIKWAPSSLEMVSQRAGPQALPAVRGRTSQSVSGRARPTPRRHPLRSS